MNNGRVNQCGLKPPRFFPTCVLVNRDSVRHSLGCLKGQDAGFPSDLVFTGRGAAHQEGGTTLFGSKISWRGRTATMTLDDWAGA